VNQATASRPVTVLYIAGSGRTGSTLLDRILGQLDGFFSAGELCNLWERGLVARRKCGCGQSVDRCVIWSAVVRRVLGSTGELGNAGLLAATTRERLRVRRLGSVLRQSPDISDEFSMTLGRLYEAIQIETGCRVIVDSSKSPVYAELLGSVPNVNLFVVHLVRDPRATAYSFRRRRQLPDFGDERLMVQQRPLVTARRWAKWQALTELLGRRRRTRYLRLRYEDLMHDPQTALNRVLNLVGETAELPFRDSSTVYLRATHSVSGNPNRFTVGEVNLRIDDEWLAKIRFRDALAVTAVTWPLLLRHSYPLWPRRQRTGRSAPPASPLSGGKRGRHAVEGLRARAQRATAPHDPA
jgi:hypothetical protein